MNITHRKPLPGTSLDYFDARAAVEALATRGLDNLALPLAGFFLLALTLPAPPALLILLAVASALLVLTALLAQALWLSPAPHSSPDGAE